MKKSSILHKDKDFKFIFAKGKKINLPALTLIYLKRPTSSNNRFAFLVGKKLSKKAHERNLIKRRMRAIVNQLKIKENGLDIILIPKTVVLEKNFQELKELIETTCRKANLL